MHLGELTLSEVVATSIAPEENPTLFGPVSSYGMQGCLNSERTIQ